MRAANYHCRKIFLVLLMIIVSSFAVSACSAESYTIAGIYFDQGWDLYGLESSGAVVVVGSGPCTDAPICYTTVFDGQASSSPTPPDVTFDDGTPCTPSVPSGFRISPMGAVCNGELEAFNGYDFANDPNQHTPDIYNGPDLADDFVAVGGGGVMMLNTSGDIVWDDAFSDEIYEAIPQTPEPSGLVLLGTGVLAAVGVRRRRLR